MHLSDKGIIVGIKPFQENSAIISVFTEQYGIYNGVSNNIKSNKTSNIYLPGNLINFHWKARLNSHLGSAKCELIKAFASHIMQNKLALYSMNSILSIVNLAIKPNTPHSNLFNILVSYLGSQDFSFPRYIETELAILKETGYSLDLKSCVATGTTENLAYVSPKSGRAISFESGKIYENMVLKLPEFLTKKDFKISPEQVTDGLNLTGYFLKRYIFSNIYEMNARNRFQDSVIEYFQKLHREELSIKDLIS